MVKKDLSNADKKIKEHETYFDDILKKKEQANIALQDTLKKIAIKGTSDKKKPNTAPMESDEMINLNTHAPIAF